MNADERLVCTEAKALALSQVRAFFDSCVPSHRKQYFTACAKKHFPELLQEVEELKVAINAEPECIQTYSHKCARYSYVSKELIRKVSFILFRSVLP